MDKFKEFKNKLSSRFAPGSQNMSKDLKNFFGKSNQGDISGSDNSFNLEQYYIPDYILQSDAEIIEKQVHVPDCPVIVFINAKSGGQLGGELLISYRSVLNYNQVFDLGEKAPDKVLHQIYRNLDKHRRNGDDFSAEIQKRLRIIVAGGDGTAGWLLGVVSDLKLGQPPPISTVPLGTGNNLPFAFGWGKKNPTTDTQSVKAFLEKVRNAKEMKVDSWHIIMRMKVPKEKSCDPIAILDLPHSLHAFKVLSQSDTLNQEGVLTFRGGFWNYFSMGMDAQVSYAFHSERKLNPEKFKNQMHNQSAYMKLGCTQGWFCPSLSHPSSKDISQMAKVKVMKKTGEWVVLDIPRSIRSIVCLNLPSFSGGFNPWGTPRGIRTKNREFTPPYVDDGCIEVVGFKNAWHGLVLLAPEGHGTRLAQTKRIRFEFHKGATDHTYMRIDGEPWKQPLPLDDETVVVEISHHSQVTMLANEPCKAKSYEDATPGDDDDDDDEDEYDEENSELRRKLGAADTFKLPDDFDLARLS